MAQRRKVLLTTGDEGGLITREGLGVDDAAPLGEEESLNSLGTEHDRLLGCVVEACDGEGAVLARQ